MVVLGTGGTSMGNDNYGVCIEDVGSRITSEGGDVLVTGTGGGIGASANNNGILISAGEITAGSTGKVTLRGTGGATTGNSNDGVQVTGIGSRITSAGGDMSVTGQGGGTAASVSNCGVLVELLGEITAGFKGKVMIHGTGGTTTGGSNYGVLIGLINAKITSSGGDISVTGIEGGGTGSLGLYNRSSGIITTVPNGGAILLKANSMSIDAPVSTPSGNAVTLLPFTNGVAINLGGSNDPIGGPLNLSDTELDRITTGTLIIGDANSDNIMVSADITRQANTAMQLVSGGDITFASGGINTTGGALLLDCGAIKPNYNGTDVIASTLSLVSPLSFVLNGPTPGDGTVNTYTQLNVTGAVDLNRTNLLLTGRYSNGSYTLILNDGTDAVTGTFKGLTEGTIVRNYLGNGKDIKVTYVGGTGNDVVLTVSDLTLSSIEPVEAGGIQIYPNPTKGVFQLSNVLPDRVMLYDYMGRLVLQLDNPGTTLDASRLPSGMYFLKVAKGKAAYSARIIKE